MSINIVQFTHSGGQYSLNRREAQNNIKEWNALQHRRKFLIAQGQYVENNVLSTSVDLLFWGEWEPTSYIKSVYHPADRVVYPTYLHSPFLKVDAKGKVNKYYPLSASAVPHANSSTGRCTPGKLCSPSFQNTDPFVFGDCFFYSLCKQERFVSLQNLDPGSIILFGSTISEKRNGPYFALDTVFVVAEKRTYTPETFQEDLAGFIPDYYHDIMGGSSWKSTKQFTCYKGATFQHPVNGMYSFVPCKLYEEAGEGGFERPNLKMSCFSPSLPRFLTDNLNSAPKYTETDVDTNKLIWDEVDRLLHSLGYKKGLNFGYQIVI